MVTRPKKFRRLITLSLILSFSPNLLADNSTHHTTNNTAENALNPQTVSTPEAVWKMVSTNPLFADGKVNITLRNMWKYLKASSQYNAEENDVMQAWGQGIEVGYNSGYFADFIGFDMTYYGAIKLAASDNFQSRAILYNNNGKAEGYNKIGQRYVKIKLGENGNRFDAKAGWIVMKNVGILTTSTRLSNNSYSGYYGKYTFSNFSGEIAYVTSTSRRDSPHKVTLQTFSGKKIDHVIMGQVNYRNKLTNLLGFYGEAEDYIRQFGLEAEQKITKNLSLGTQIYAQYAVDKNDALWTSSKNQTKKPFDSNAWHYAFVGAWSEPKWTLKLGVGYTHAPKEGDGMGSYSRNIIKNTRGRFNSMAYADIDYMRDGERYVGIDFEYKLMPDYSVGIRNMNSHNKYKGNNLNEHNVTLFNYWNPIWMKNFSVYADVGFGWHYRDNAYRTPYLDKNGDAMRSHSLAGSMTATYRF